MDAQIARLLRILDGWRDRRVSVAIDWTRETGALLRMVGVLGEVERRSEPDHRDDVQVFVSVPVGDGFVLMFDSHGVVEIEHEAAAMTIQLHDDLAVVLSLA